MKKYLSQISIVLILISILGFVFYSINIMSWKFIFVGDEWPFYSFAKNIADNNFKVNPFSMNGVYGEHRVLGSFWQAIVVKLFPQNPVIGWRVSSTILVFPTILFLYLWIKRLSNKNIALYSSFLLSSSFVLANFSKIGYLNSIAFTLFIISLYFATRAGQSQNIKDYVYLAIILGLSFYVYIGPLYPLIIFPCLFADYKSINIKVLFRNLLILIFLYLAIISIGPLSSNTDYSLIFKKTLIREFSGNLQILVNIWHNFFSFYRDYDYCSNHFVTGPSLDIISRLFCFTGTLVVFSKIKELNYRLILSLYIMTCFVIGITSPYPYSPITREIFLLPFGFIFASIGIYKIINLQHKNISWLIFVSIFFLNFYLSQYWVFSKVGYSRTGLILRELMLSPNIYKPFYLITSYDAYNYNNIDIIRNALKNNDPQLIINTFEEISCNNKSKFHTIVFESDKGAMDKIKLSGCYLSHDPELTIITDLNY